MNKEDLLKELIALASQYNDDMENNADVDYQIQIVLENLRSLQ